MAVKWIPLSFLLMALSLQAESQRKEPSLLLEYERELKKVNDSQKASENPFTKNTSLITVTKPAVPVPPTVPVVTLKETKRPVPDPIGQDVNPFLVVPKPAPVASSELCPDPSSSQQTASSSEHKGVAKHLANAKNKLLAKAKEFLGTPYGFGGKSDERTDCSGFTRQVFSQFGIDLPRSAAEQAEFGETVSLSDLQVGDLLFYRTYKSDPSHVAIYAGDGQIIHASYNARRVQFDSIEKGYYRDRFLFAKRIALKSSENTDRP